MYKDNQERIDAYLRGEMTEADKIKFEDDLNSDLLLRHDYERTKAISNALADRKHKLAQMSKWDEEEKIQNKEQHHRLIIKRWTIGMSAAACLAIGFLAIKPMFITHTSESNYAMPDFGTTAVYRGGDDSITEVDSLIKAKDYDMALSKIDTLISECRDNISALELTDSLTEKDAYRLKEYGQDLYQLEWRRINLLLATDNEQDGKQALETFIKKDGEYSYQADSLLRTLTNKTK